jgi:hypothetical protein
MHRNKSVSMISSSLVLTPAPEIMVGGGTLAV